MGIDLKNWMQNLPDGSDLLALNLCGTHDCVTQHIRLPHFFCCQDLTVYEQLLLGVRALDIRVRAGCVDDEDVEEEQAQRAEQNQHHIRHDAPRGQRRMGAGLLVFCLGLHFHRCLTHAALPPFTAFAAFTGLGLRSSSPRVVRMMTTHSTAQITNMMADTAPARP